MPTCNQICSLNWVTSFNYYEAVLLSLDKAFSYRPSTRQRAKIINFKKMITIVEAMFRWIETFKDSHLYVCCDNFAVANGVLKISLREKAMQSLCKIAMLCAEHNIKHWISIKQNFLANMLSRSQYGKIANKYLFLQIVQNVFGIPPKAGM